MPELYVLMKTECPECGGEGRLETMTMLTYDGAQSWRVETCPHCHGERFSMEHVKCPLCTDDILENESEWSEGTVYHASCLEEERVAKQQPAFRCPGCGELKIEERIYCTNCGTDFHGTIGLTFGT